MKERFSTFATSRLFVILAEWIWNLEGKEDNDIDDHDNDNKNNNSSSNNMFYYSPSLCLDHIGRYRIQEFVFDSGCFSQLVTKVLGIVMIVGAFFNKAPTLLNLVETQSAEGLSPMALYSEVLFFTNSSIYSLLSGHPITAVRW